MLDTNCQICKTEIPDDNFEEINISSKNNDDVYFKVIICKKCVRKTFNYEKNIPIQSSFGWSGEKNESSQYTEEENRCVNEF